MVIKRRTQGAPQVTAASVEGGERWAYPLEDVISDPPFSRPERSAKSSARPGCEGLRRNSVINPRREKSPEASNRPQPKAALAFGWWRTREDSNFRPSVP